MIGLSQRYAANEQFGGFDVVCAGQKDCDTKLPVEMSIGRYDKEST